MEGSVSAPCFRYCICHVLNLLTPGVLPKTEDRHRPVCPCLSVCLQSTEPYSSMSVRLPVSVQAALVTVWLVPLNQYYWSLPAGPRGLGTRVLSRLLTSKLTSKLISRLCM